MFGAMGLEARGKGLAARHLGDLGQTIFLLNPHLSASGLHSDPLGSPQLLDHAGCTGATNVLWAESCWGAESWTAYR